MRTRKPNLQIARDSMGQMLIPSGALYGASTQRAVLNFQISRLRLPRSFIAALGEVKYAAAEANRALALLDRERAAAIKRAADEVARGELDAHFVVDVFQTGSGTSSNMNANEVIAARAMRLLPKRKIKIHPNDHVNLGQSSNDVIPSALHISAFCSYRDTLVPALNELRRELQRKSRKFGSIIKAGRTHLQDATPITLGQEFSGYAARIGDAEKQLGVSADRLLPLALGGTAVGTGINTHPRFARLAIAIIRRRNSAQFVETSNHFAAQSGTDAAVAFSGALRGAAIAIYNIADDLRRLAAGPRCNIAEIRLPEVQPGSSIMPGKVNPVICESAMMAAARVIANDLAVGIGGQTGNFELNTMLPLTAYCLLESIEILGNSARNLARLCVAGIEADRARCAEYAEMSLATCTALAARIGYDRTAEIAKYAMREGISARAAARKLSGLSQTELGRILDIRSMVRQRR